MMAGQTILIWAEDLSGSCAIVVLQQAMEAVGHTAPVAVWRRPEPSRLEILELEIRHG